MTPSTATTVEHADRSDLSRAPARSLTRGGVSPTTRGSTRSRSAQVGEGDGHAAALVNFRFIANTVWTPKEAVKAMQAH